ncbi:hypothetical protein C1752_08278 [Acaryochloris thomasi RCC1774]|uniref:Uncharacterized protein n=1 Tax=Acaryochloris thomasi RCC1774 TaxID=1764569 RepID=A0A2W1JHM6_9CYAN|nr:hypothetical protein [Acaryochloris thomasi]PZD71075.1 hypothetical protein C1752_08278 [Acaryochloris thomasi RCC1774]
MASPLVVYFNTTWDYTAHQPLQELIDTGIATSIYEYDPAFKGQQLYFCYRCGYPCYRNPTEGVSVNPNKRPFFAHYSIPNHPPCKLRTSQGEGQSYSSEVIKGKAVEDQCLTIIDSWCSLPEEQELAENESSQYSGTVEDEFGPPACKPIVRYLGLQELTERRIYSVQYIAWHLHLFIDRDIQLPECLHSNLFQDAFIHASAVFSLETGTPGLYWGRVRSLMWIGEFLYIAFGYDTHCFYLAISKENVKARGWSVDYLQGRYIVAAGQLAESLLLQDREEQFYSSRVCRVVEAQEWGASGIVSRKEERFLPSIDVEWVDPAIFPNKTPITNEDVARSREKRLKTFDVMIKLVEKIFKPPSSF